MIKNKIRYIIFFILTLFLFTRFRGRTLFLMTTVLIVLPFITWIQAKRMLKKLKVSVSFDKDMVGRNAENFMKITVLNKVHMPSTGVTLNITLANLFYEEEKSFKVDIPVLGYGENSVMLAVKAENCGNIVVKRVKVTMWDLLNLFCFKKDKEAKGKYMVIPSYIYSPSDNVSYKPEDDSDVVMHEVGEDTSEIESIREYRAGDRMQRIHWKLTSKMEEMQVKEYAINYDIDISLVCDINVNEAHACLDELLDALYSLMMELCTSNERYSFYFANKEHDGVICLSISSQEDVLEAMGQLYYIKPYEQPGLAVSYAKAMGAEPVMNLKWTDAGDGTKEVLYEFGDKVVLVWE